MESNNSFQKKDVRVLVTGVGAIIGYGIIKSLRQSDYSAYIVGMDIYEDAVGQHWCDKFIQAKYAVDPEYIDFLKKVITDNEIDIVFFGTEQEIYRINEAREELGDDFIKKLVINRKEILELSQDKWLTREYLIQNEMSDLAIDSVIIGSYKEIAEMFGVPILLKPRRSYASKGIVAVSNSDDFEYHKKKMGSNFMAQRFIGDNEHEYTVGVFGLGDGTYSGEIVMRRKLSQEGSTAKAEVIFDERISNCVKRLTASLKPIGPTNYQFRLDNEKFYLLEVNPRISSSTSLRMAFGFNEAAMCIDYFVNGEIVEPNVKPGFAVRYIDEVIIEK